MEVWCFGLVVAYREFKLHVYGKRQTANGRRQIQVENFSKNKTSRQKQVKTILMDEKLRGTANLGVEIMHSKRQVKRKLGHVVQIRVRRLT